MDKELLSGDSPRVPVHHVGKWTLRGSRSTPVSFPPSVGRTKTRGASQAMPVWNVYKLSFYLQLITETIIVGQERPSKHHQNYKHLEPTTIEQDQDEWRLASGAGLDCSKLSLYQFFK